MSIASLRVVPQRPSEAWHGTMLVLLSAFAFSLAGFFVRLIDTDVWTMLFWRGLFGGLFIAGWVLCRDGGQALTTLRRVGPLGLVAAVCSIVLSFPFGLIVTFPSDLADLEMRSFAFGVTGVVFIFLLAISWAVAGIVKFSQLAIGTAAMTLKPASSTCRRISRRTMPRQLLPSRNKKFPCRKLRYLSPQAGRGNARGPRGVIQFDQNVS